LSVLGKELPLSPLDPRSLIETFGVVSIFVTLFAETGLLIGVVLPGDSLLLTAGLLSSRAGAGGLVQLSLAWALVAAAAGTVLGAQVGYLIGHRATAVLTAKAGHVRFTAATSRVSEMLDRYGHGRALVLARFVPVVRTMLGPGAGSAGIPVRTFVLWQAVGGILWASSLILAGYLLGDSVGNVDRYLLPMIGIVIALSLAPVLLEFLRVRRRRGAR
jgi:membrane-associated protein